jgi:L-threonylcarbamoyladenylate synthase
VVNPWKIKQAADVVVSGGIIAYPTEAVYGLGCDPFNDMAVVRLLQLKHRAPEKGLILVAATLDQLEPVITIPNDEIRRKISATWPGAVTWVVPARPGISPLLTGAHQSLAVRVSAHPVVQALCREIDQPLVSTSANLESGPPARSALAVRRIFNQQVDYIVHGTVNRAANPTEIRDALTGRILRPA